MCVIVGCNFFIQITVADDEKLAAIADVPGLDDRDTHDLNPNLAPRSPPLEPSSSDFGPGPGGGAASAPTGADSALSQSQIDCQLRCHTKTRS
jgi:hypothetical protein